MKFKHAVAILWNCMFAGLLTADLSHITDKKVYLLDGALIGLFIGVTLVVICKVIERNK